MENIINKAKELTYSSLEYVDPSEISNGKVLLNSDDIVFIYDKTNADKTLHWSSKSEDNIMLHWGAKSKEYFFEGLTHAINFIKENEQKTEKVYIEFIPEDFLEEMYSKGFIIASEWVDFWNIDLSTVNVEAESSVNIRKLEHDEISEASNITRSCIGCSRGFSGESEAVLEEWLSSDNSYLFAAEKDNNLVGVCHVKLYGFESEKGTVLWLREVAVRPEYQGSGIGRALILHGLNWGIEMGAVRSFLACDAENSNAIKLYESLRYRRNDDRGQINMELKLR